ncbi:helix-turn-helix domain-containing protein [Bittarella massiliensis (ex Durand et al. 2017)]|uniref:helix-turn-helix domain-containing protein n=1 Tax=Bittarella massiliensis (ex Durand et al. 2017) TaxID=1720313 RepID=UPI00073F3E01|nr:helix-turn-helix domain-containing protein [Bittarella massiliensis (ex Durand et al. 2017)]
MKILIADDEAPIRDWFAYVLTQKIPGLKAQVETAAGGLEALEKMEKDPPDVVFADIKMPGLDGIGLIEQAKERFPRTVFVILTNHAEFTFAQRAVGLGVYDYLLKSEITAEKVAQTLADIQKGFFTAAPQPAGAGEVERIEEPEGVDWPALARRLGADGPGRYRAVAVRGADRGAVLQRQLPDTPLTPVLWGDCWEALLPAGAAGFPGWEPPFAVGLSAPHAGAEGLQAALQEAVLALETAFLSGRPGLYRFGDAQEPPQLDSALHALRKRLSTEIAYGGVPTVRGDLSQFLTRCAQAGPTRVDWVRKNCHRLLAQMEDRYLQELREIEPDARRVGKPVRSLEDFRAQMEEMLAAVEERQGERDAPAIDTAVRYIERHYGDSALSLTKLAGSVHLSPEYFCRLFKQKTGVSYGTYLTTYRLTRARELICTTDLKMAEVARQVGYENASYFSRLYKKHMGLSPEQERRAAPPAGQN